MRWLALLLLWPALALAQTYDLALLTHGQPTTPTGVDAAGEPLWLPGPSLDGVTHPDAIVFTLTHRTNASGQAVGQFWDSGTVRRTFFWNGATFTTLAVPGANTGQTIAWGLNDDGVIVGSFGTGTGPSWKGFVRSVGGAYTTVEYPEAAGTAVLGINAAGVIVGTFWHTVLPLQPYTWGAFIGTPP